ncbi:MAG: glycosyltransferase [Cyanobacteria bacterium P01_A01_bin.135]
MENTTKRRSLKEQARHLLDWLALLLLPILGGVGLYSLRSGQLSTTEVSGLISLGAVGTWRWSWWLCQVLRSRIYLHGAFPRWRRRADSIPVEDLPPVCLLIPTYKEKLWITERVFRVLAQEAQTLAHPVTMLVTSSSLEENDAIRRVIQSVDPHLKQIRLVEMVQTGEGKRKAMAEGLRKLATLGLPKNTIVALMDGDSELTPGTLKRCLPFFNLYPKLGALTTDELPVVEGSYLFSEWFHLRFAQRHYQMCSVSLSQKIMCLTGRFSLFRGEAALDPTFADILETDTLDDWLWGRFKFLSGDDKSTWFWLLQRGYDMIYVPDVIVYSIETISGSFFDRAYQNMRRWYGNMLRNSSRAIALGPQKSGWFMWYCLIDQRISFWTSLITPGAIVLFLVQQNWLAFGLVCCWVCFSRPLMLMIIFFGRQSHLKLIHIPVFLAAQWSSCIVKIWTQMNLAQQKWKNRGNQSISAAGTGWTKVARLGTSRFLYGVQLFCFAILLCWLADLVNPFQDSADLLWHLQAARSTVAAEQVIDAQVHGVIPNDNQDDAVALQALLTKLPTETSAVVQLPAGTLDIFQPITINRSRIAIAGQGSRRTILKVHLEGWRAPQILTIQPPTEVAPSSPSKPPKLHLEDVRLEEFAVHIGHQEIVDAQPIDVISIQDTFLSHLNRLDIEHVGSAIHLKDAQEIHVDYTSLSQVGHQQPVLMTQTLNVEGEVHFPTGS